MQEELKAIPGAPGSGVWYQYLRRPSKAPYAIVGFIVRGGVMYSACAFTNPVDQFVRREGKNKVNGRLVSLVQRTAHSAELIQRGLAMTCKYPDGTTKEGRDALIRELVRQYASFASAAERRDKAKLYKAS
jgi:hypothetical protein